ncbi:putative RNA-directed DNA polymerase from transposon X-element [Trichonephila clavipes]|nr:putative RNA-directed DNA polymerase from transposon X-element [Trichonephila clavipes]
MPCETSSQISDFDREGIIAYRDCGLAFSEIEANPEKTILVPEENIFVEKRKFKLPKFEFRKFRGEPNNFLAFRSQFDEIHWDTTIAEEDKFQYLLRCVGLDSKAAKSVSSFPQMKDNCSKAIDQLKERFGRDKLLVRDLLFIVMQRFSKCGACPQGVARAY